MIIAYRLIHQRVAAAPRRIGPVAIAQFEHSLVGKNDRRQREFGHRHRIGIRRMRHPDSGIVDGVVERELHRACRMGDKLEIGRGLDHLRSDHGTTPAGHEDVDFTKHGAGLGARQFL
jgi:hypothetical protein